MNTTYPDISHYSYPGIRKVHQFIALYLALMVLYALVVGSFHHHHDLADHPYCAACVVVHHKANIISAIPTLPILLLPTLVMVYTRLVLSLSDVNPIAPPCSRAPPL